MLLFVGEGYDFVDIGMAFVKRGYAGVEHEVDFDARETLFKAPAQSGCEHGVADAAKTDD